jgi:hypothetical protein
MTVLSQRTRLGVEQSSGSLRVRKEDCGVVMSHDCSILVVQTPESKTGSGRQEALILCNRHDRCGAKKFVMPSFAESRFPQRSGRDPMDSRLVGVFFSALGLVLHTMGLVSLHCRDLRSRHTLLQSFSIVRRTVYNNDCLIFRRVRRGWPQLLWEVTTPMAHFLG